MKFKTVLAMTLLGVFTASAEVVIFTQTLTDTATGNERVMTRTYAGWLVYDTNTQEIRDVLARKLNKSDTPKTFSEIGSGASVQFFQPNSTQLVLWAVVPLFDTGGATFKGTAAPMTIGTSNVFPIPKTLAVKGASVESSISTLHEFTGTLVLDSKSTVAANKAGQDISTVVANFENQLLTQGYTQR